MSKQNLQLQKSLVSQMLAHKSRDLLCPLFFSSYQVEIVWIHGLQLAE